MNIVQLLEKSSNIYIQNPDDFLKKITTKTFTDKKALTEIETLLKSSSSIGTNNGAGRVYKTKNGIIIKVVKYCSKKTEETDLINHLCKLADEGDVIYHIPDTNTGKECIYAPNYLTENLIGILLSEKMERYSKCFMKVYGFQYDRESSDKITYTLSEELYPKKERVSSVEDVIFLNLQIMRALDVSQKIGRFTHYDLHQDNVMIRKYKEPQINEIKLDNGEYLYTYFDYDPVIIDYGLSRFETEKTVLSPKGKMGNNTFHIHENYYFNPYYDLFTFLYTQNALATDSFNQSIKEVIAEIYYMFIDVPKNAKSKELFSFKFTEYLKNGTKWRPKAERLTTEVPEIKWHRVRSASELFNDCVNKFLARYRNSFNESDASNAFDALIKNKFLISSTKLAFNQKVTSLEYPTKTFKYNLYRTMDERKKYSLQIDNIIQIKSTNEFPDYIDKKIHSYHYELTDNMKKAKSFSYPIDDAWLHASFIDQEKGVKNRYKFHFDCCRLDMRSYLQSETIKTGITINASFFKLKEDYSPIGYFRTHNYESNNKIPEKYQKYYGLLYTDKNGLLNICADSSEFSKIIKNESNKNILSCGPIIVKGGAKIMTQSMLSKYKELQCMKINDEDQGINDTINCKDILPGELSHSANPNPRSVIFLTKSNTVGIFYVEGRDEKGPGMDLSQLADLCIKYGAVTAMNLDGGRSSQLMWKDEGVIYQTNTVNMSAYPVGTIISFTR